MSQPQYKEIWKPIKGFEGFYEVSSFGRIKSLGTKTRIEKIRVPSAAPNGYLRMVLSANNKQLTISLHRETAKAFIENPNNYDTVNHKDYDKTNNNVENLEWCTIKENVNHGRHFKKKIIQRNKAGHFIKLWDSAWQVQQTLGWFSTHISACCRGIKKTYKNFKWEFYEA